MLNISIKMMNKYNRKKNKQKMIIKIKSSNIA